MEKINLGSVKKDLMVAIKDKKRWLLCLLELAIAGILILIDLLGKKYIYGYCEANHDIEIIKGVIGFTAVQNTGAGFGMLAGKTTALSIISCLSSLVLIFIIFYSYPRRNKWLRASYVLILGGALGNIIDRIALGYVRDFVHFKVFSFPVWNFADTFLTVGTILLIIYLLFFFSQDEKARAELLKQNSEGSVAREKSEIESEEVGVDDNGDTSEIVPKNTSENTDDRA